MRPAEAPPSQVARMITFTAASSWEGSGCGWLRGLGVYRRVFGYDGSIGANDKALSGSTFGGMLVMMVSEESA